MSPINLGKVAPLRTMDDTNLRLSVPVKVKGTTRNLNRIFIADDLQETEKPLSGVINDLENYNTGSSHNNRSLTSETITEMIPASSIEPEDST